MYYSYDLAWYMFLCYQDYLVKFLEDHLRRIYKKYLNSLSIIFLSILDGMCKSNPYGSASFWLTFKLNNNYLKECQLLELLVFSARVSCQWFCFKPVSCNCQNFKYILFVSSLQFLHSVRESICAEYIYIFCFSENIHLRFVQILQNLR